MKHDLATREELRAELNQKLESGEIELHEALKLFRKVLGKNQLEYSKIVGISKKAVSEFEVGKGNPTIKTVNKLFFPLGVQVGLVKKRR